MLPANVVAPRLGTVSAALRAAAPPAGAEGGRGPEDPLELRRALLFMMGPEAVGCMLGVVLLGYLPQDATRRELERLLLREVAPDRVVEGRAALVVRQRMQCRAAAPAAPAGGRP